MTRNLTLEPGVGGGFNQGGLNRITLEFWSFGWLRPSSHFLTGNLSNVKISAISFNVLQGWWLGGIWCCKESLVRSHEASKYTWELLHTCFPFRLHTEFLSRFHSKAQWHNIATACKSLQAHMKHTSLQAHKETHIALAKMLKWNTSNRTLESALMPSRLILAIHSALYTCGVHH